MKPDSPLVILEIRTGHPDNLARFESDPPESFLGPELAGSLKGLHLEADFLFLFFAKSVDPQDFLARFPELELRQTHELRYDQWQDGAGSPPFSVGPITIRPVFGTDFGPGPDQAPKNGQDVANGGLGAPQGGPGIAKPLLIDPGLAFGFGGHPTTRACLEFLARLYRPGTTVSPSPETALDLGCGTGILALAAARLGAKKVLGLDHSHLAVDAANHNARLNNLAGSVTVKRALAQDFAAYPASLLLANIPLFVLRDLVELGAFAGRDYSIVSGLLPEEGDTFLELLSPKLPHKILDARRSDRWISYLIQPAA